MQAISDARKRPRNKFLITALLATDRPVIKI